PAIASTLKAAQPVHLISIGLPGTDTARRSWTRCVPALENGSTLPVTSNRAAPTVATSAFGLTYVLSNAFCWAGERWLGCSTPALYRPAPETTELTPGTSLIALV